MGIVRTEKGLSRPFQMGIENHFLDHISLTAFQCHFIHRGLLLLRSRLPMTAKLSFRGVYELMTPSF